MSLVVQWLRICLLVQGTQVPSLVREDDMCCEATQPAHHNYCNGALQSVLRSGRKLHGSKPETSTREQPRLAPTRESPPAATKTQSGHKY